MSAGKLYVGRHGGELLQDCVQLHGGIGVTFDHDLHLFPAAGDHQHADVWRPGEHAARISDLLEAQEGH